MNRKAAKSKSGSKPKAKPRVKRMVAEKPDKAYHHGDLAPALRQAARVLLEEEGLEALSLRSVARRAGVSHAAPYRHYASHESLLAELAAEGFDELRRELRVAGSAPGALDERIAHIGAAYTRFAARHGALLRLMFGSALPHRAAYPALAGAADSVGEEIGNALDDSVLGLAVWATVHGLAMLILEDVIDLGQRKSGMDVMPSRAEILLRSLFSRTME